MDFPFAYVDVNESKATNLFVPVCLVFVCLQNMWKRYLITSNDSSYYKLAINQTSFLEYILLALTNHKNAVYKKERQDNSGVLPEKLSYMYYIQDRKQKIDWK